MEHRFALVDYDTRESGARRIQKALCVFSARGACLNQDPRLTVQDRVVGPDVARHHHIL